MRIIGKTGREDIAIVYLAETMEGRFVEFVESVQPPTSRNEKWVLIVSSLLGCPVNCLFCDAGGWYNGKLSKEEILEQIDYMITSRFPGKKIPVKKLKIQFARVGEPSFNPNVLDVLEELPKLYDAPGILPCISTVAPKGNEKFFERLLTIKERFYRNGRFQLQFSLHSTDENIRDRLIPVNKWSFKEIAAYGKRFNKEGERKITLNFALNKEAPVDPNVLLDFFDPEKFLIKITPVNPTVKAAENKIESLIKSHPTKYAKKLIDELKKIGYEVIVSIGELEENKIGSNCGMYIQRFLKEKRKIKDAYEYKIASIQ
ncbi:MAG TPA: radical SAM protein [Thermoplasmata archaeon]|nr:radical SAM protein [Thermoplasmata archaeon]